MTDAMPEIWRPVVGHEGRYEVSNRGRVRSTSAVQGGGCVLSLMPQHGGHLLVNLVLSPLPKKGKRFHARFVHHLVLDAFVGSMPADGMVCRHLNGDPTDNRPENLKWGTYAENGADMIRHGTSHQTRKSECPSGHAYTPENTRVWRGRRFCRTCSRERAAAWRNGQSWPLATQEKQSA